MQFLVLTAEIHLQDHLQKNGIEFIMNRKIPKFSKESPDMSMVRATRRNFINLITHCPFLTDKKLPVRKGSMFEKVLRQ